jgi:dCTP deaminase
MILTGSEIQKRIGTDIFIDPFDIKQLNPNSYNLRLHNELLIYNEDQLDCKKKHSCQSILIPESGFCLQPMQLYLARTVEYTKTFNLVPMLEGRSSIGRLGLFVHVTAGFGDVGFCGYWTLEMFCIKPIIIYPNIEICQLYYHFVNGEIVNYVSNKYQNNTDIQPSLLYKEFLLSK